MALSGVDLIFGFTWLKGPGPVITDHSLLIMKFKNKDNIVELQGRTGSGPKEITHSQVKCFIHTHRASAYFHLQLSPTSTHTPVPTSVILTLPPPLQHLLHPYTSFFQQPNTLQPSHTTGHSIHLLPNSNPVNVKLYKYPYFQKQEIEKQVSEILQNRMIHPSRSPFSFPVLLVKKKGGTWRFCVGYRALNAIKVKDRFPIPTIDELLDDLGRAS